METSKRKINELTQERDATQVARRPIMPPAKRRLSIKEAVAEEKRKKALEEKRAFLKDFEEGNYLYEQLRKEADLQRKKEEERKKAELEARKKLLEEEEKKKKESNEKYDQQREAWVDNHYDDDSFIISSAKGVADAITNITGGKDYEGLRRGIIGTIFDLKNQLGTTAESMDEGDLNSTLGDISRAKLNLGAAAAHANVLKLQQQRDQLIKDDIYNGILPEVASADPLIKEIDEQLKSLQELDDLYKKTYIGERPIGFWNRVGEFFRDDLWEGIQDAMTYDSAKEYTKQRRTNEANAEYDRQLREKGVLTGVNRQFMTPLGMINDDDYTRELNDVKRFVGDTNKILDNLGKEYERKLKDYEDTKSRWNVATGYKDMIEAYQNGSLFDKNYIFAEYAQMLGSSLSSKEQLAATAMRFGGMAAAGAAALTGNAWAAAPIINATEAIITPLEYAGAVQENDIERATKYVDNIEAYIKNSANGGEEAWNRITDDMKALATKAYRAAGLTEQQIKDRLSGPNVMKNLISDAAAGIISNEDPILKNAELYANRGLDAQQDANNFRTVSNLVLQKALVWMPVNGKALAGKAWTTVDKAAERAISNEVKYAVDETAKKTLRTRIANKTFSEKDVLDRYERMYGKPYRNGSLSSAAKRGYESGVMAGAAAGYGLAGQLVFGATGAALNSAVHLARTQLTPDAQRLLSQVERFAARKYQLVYDKLLKDHDFAKLALQYGYKQAKVNTLSALSEGAEEAAQYIHEKNSTFARKYGWDGMNLGDMIANDITVGGEIMNAYLAMLGIGDSPWANDEEFWSNWKGGAMLGFTNQSSLVNAVIRGQETVKQYRVDKALNNVAIVNRELDDRDRAAYTDVARQVMANNTQYVLNYLDRMDAEESRRQDRVTTPKEIQDTKRAVLAISQLANDKAKRKLLEDSGIAYGSEEYAIAIADQYALQNQLRNIFEQRTSGVGELSQVYSSREYNEELDDQVKIVNSQHADYKNDKESAARQAGDIAVNKAKKAREIAQQVASGQITQEEAAYTGEVNQEYASMSDEDFNKELGRIRSEAEEAVNNSSDALLKQQLASRSKAINRLTALLQLKAKFNTIEGFFNFIHDNFKMNPMRPDAKAILKNIDSQIEQAKKQLRETDSQYERDGADMSEKELYDYLLTSLVSANTHKDIAIQIEQENAVLNAWGSVVQNHMTQLGTEKYKRRIDAIKKAREDNQKLNWMISEIETGDAISRLDEVFAKEDAEAAKKAVKEMAKEANAETSTPDFEKRTDGLKSNLSKNREEFHRRRAEARSRKIDKRYKRRRSNKLMSGIPFQNIFMDVMDELMYAAEVGSYKFSEFVADLKDWAQNNDINIDDRINDIKQYYIRFRAKASKEVKANLDAAPEVIKFFAVQTPPVDPADKPSEITLQEKIVEQGSHIVHDISSHFDVVYDDGTTRKIYVNKEAIKYAKYDENVYVLQIAKKLKDANTSDEEFAKALEEETRAYPGFPVQQYTEYRKVDGIEEAIARRMLSWSTNTHVNVGIAVQRAVQAIVMGDDSLVDKSLLGEGYDDFKQQILKIKDELGESLVLISTPNYLLYTDKSGKDCAALADVVYADKDGNLYIIDVRSTIYPSVRSHYTYRSKKGFTIEDQVVDTLKEADEALTQLSGSAAKGLYMLPVVVHDNKIGVEYDEDGKALFQVKDRIINTDLNLDQLKELAEKVVAQINEKINKYNDMIREAGIYNTKYESLPSEEFQEQSSAALYETYIRNLSAKMDDIQESMEALDGHIALNMSTYTEDVLLLDFNQIDVNLVGLSEAVQTLKERVQELDATIDLVEDAGLFIAKATTYDEHALVDKFISAIVDAQVALDIALTDKNSQDIDLTAETTVIAAALQKIQLNKQNFGKAGVAVQNWWINNFAFGVKNNATGQVQSVREQQMAYFNLLNSWVNTIMVYNDDTDKWVFNPELVEVLDNPANVNIRRWYTSIINNGLSTLLDNFKDSLSTILNYDGIYDKKIAFAQWMINQFNLAWGTETDQSITNNPADYLQRIQNLSVKWKDLHSESESHSPAYASKPNDNRSMSTNRIYLLMSMVPDFEKNGKFVLDVVNGELRLYITAPMPDGQKKSIYLPFMSTPYDGITEKDLRRLLSVNRGNLKFIDKAKALIEYAKKHPEYEVRFDVFTNKGSIRYDAVGTMHNVQDWLLAGKNLFTISLSKADRIGILRTTITERNGKFYYVYGGDQLKEIIGLFDDEFRKQEVSANSGSIIYFRPTGSGKSIGVVIEPVSIGNNMAARIADLIAKQASGVTKQDGFSIDSLLKLVLYTRDKDSKVSSYNNINSLVLIEGPNVKIGNSEPMNIFSLRLQIIDRLSKLNMCTNSELLNSMFLTSQLLCLQQVKLQIANGAQYVDLPIGIRINAEDVIHRNESGANGSTWLGYMLRNGLLYTRAIGEGYRLINIRNLRLENKDNPSESKPVLESAPVNSLIETIDLDNMFSRLKMTVSADELNVRVDDEEQQSFSNAVDKYFKTVFGEDLVGLWEVLQKGVIQRLPTGYVVGECTTDLMTLSMYAPESAAWHEAFHRVTELLLTEDERSVFYKIYQDRYGVSDPRSVAEGLADLFVDYTSRVGLPKNGKFGKIKTFFKSIYAGIFVVRKLGIKDTRKLFAFFNDINKGAYRTRTVSKENEDRFNRLFDGYLHYTVTNQTTGQTADLLHIADSGELNEMVNSLGYYITKALGYDKVSPDTSKSVKIDESIVDKIPAETLAALRGDNVPEDELTSSQRAFREVLDKNNFGAILEIVANYVGGILNVQPRGNIVKPDDEEQRKDNDLGEYLDAQNLNIDRFDKASYEFSKLASLSSRVKLFFATIPYTRFDNNGKLVTDVTRNAFGTPTYMPIEEVYSILENDLSDVKSIDELYNKLKKLAINSEMHRAVFFKFHSLVYGIGDEGGIYGADQFGNIVCRDYDREQLAIQIVSALSSLKIDFIVALSENLGEDEGKEIRISSSSLERDSRSLPKQWGLILTSGQSQVFAISRDRGGNILFKDRKQHKKGEEQFAQTIQFFLNVREALSLNNGTITIGGKEYNKDSVDGINAIKAEFVNHLHKMGVMISNKAFDYMLLNGFGDAGAQGFINCLNGSGGNEMFKPQSIESFLVLLNSIISQNGSISEDVITKGYPENGFIKLLATWQGMYNRVTVQNMALGLNGKLLFSISQNSAISHIIQALNEGNMDNDVVKTLAQFNYNMIDGNIPIGSIILKAIRNKENIGKITAHTYIGLKTDNFGDNGSEYTDAAEIDDYMAKLTMLLEGYMLFPTLADKGTWLVLKGIRIPGMRLITSRKDKQRSVRCENPVQVTFVGEKPYIMPSEDTIDQMIEYAKTERAAIVQCMEDLKTMPEDAKINNYHTINKNTPKDKDGKIKFVVEPNGTRFLLLTKVYIEDGGKLVGKNLNDPKKSSKEMLAEADRLFFSKDIDTQRRIMGLTLAVQAEHEIQKALDLGIVERIDYKKSWKTSDGEDVSVNFAKDQDTLWNLKSLHLNNMLIQAVANELMKQISHKKFGTWAAIPNDAMNIGEKLAKIEMTLSLAVAAILADATYRHIISSQEVLRCFAGHPGMFKVEYTENGIKNSTADIQKRLGGLVSTGEDNVLGIPGMPTKYICAELKDYKVSSRSRVSKDLKDMFVTALVRNVYAILTGRWDDAYGMSKEEILEATKNSEYEPKIEKAVHDGEEFAAMFDGGINVADGAAYITDTMCENLLRMRGAYNNKVRKAFDILRSDKAVNWKKSKEAYKVIYDAVNIVTTKYTAYGFRDHATNGEKYSNISVPYYNKYALFPLFKCVATGKMGKIYDKMLNEGVDMLMMTSAVKVGSCGAVSFDGNTIEAPFNKYEQDFGYLRRQLNTDPEEGEEITMGTQMIKIVLLNLIGERTYKDARTGREVSGDEILEDMMGAINHLSEIGEQEIMKMFTSDGYNIDPKKLANYLLDQLTSRNANKVLLDIIRPYTDKTTGLINVHALSATADASWIESILISEVNKHVIDITTPGSSFVQRSVFAMDAEDGEGLIQGDENLDVSVNGGKRLQMLNEDGSMDAVVSIDFFDDLFKGKDMSFEEKRDYLIKSGIIGNVAANTVAYRIPTQAQSSIHALRIVDVVSAVKSTIILPEEFTRITGSDFDIDHLYLARYNYSFDKNQNKHTSWMKKGSKRYYQNKILGNIITLLTDVNSINTTYKSIDSDVELPQRCSRLIKQKGSLEAEPYNFGTLRALVSVKNDFVSGKVSIGPFALNSTSHQLTTHYDVKFRPTIVTEKTPIEGFTRLLDDDGNFISAWLSGYISGAVDNAKDPFLASLNTNLFTYNMLNLLLRNGFGETAVWFCAQPIIRDMSAANERSKSLYAKDMSYKNSGYSRKEYAIILAVKQYVPETAITPQQMKKWTTSTAKTDQLDRVRVINWVNTHKELLRLFATNPTLQRITIDGVDYSRGYVQQQVFFAWKSLEKYATALGSLVQHTKIDTRKHGKSIIEINRYLDGYNKIFHPDDPRKSIWDVQGLQDFARRTWLEQKTNAAIQLPSRILGRYTFSANPQFISAVLGFAEQLTEPGQEISMDVVNKISRHLQTAVKSQYFVDFVADNLVARDAEGRPTETADLHIRNLFVGPRSISRRLTGLKLAIEMNPTYKRLASNGLIRQLYSITEEDPKVLHGELTELPAFITVLDSVDSSKINSDALIDGWEDLLKDEDKYVRAFAQDLIIYAFMTSGEFKGWSKLFKYVPASWITGEINPDYTSYATYIENILSGGYDYRKHFDDIAANCFGDMSIVESVPVVNKDKSSNFIDANTVCKIGKPIDISEVDSTKPYILVKQDMNGRNTDAYNLYKLIGFKSESEDSVAPVYIRMKKRGYSRKNNNIYEYGWDFQFRGNENRTMNENYDIDQAVHRISGNDINDASTAASVQARYLELAKPHVEEAPTEQPNTINIYWSTNENPYLSNFATRPFVFNLGGGMRTFDSVEQAFHTAKLKYALPITQQPLDVLEAFYNPRLSPSQARKYGRKIAGLNSEEWDKDSLKLMHDLIKASFEQNPQALQRLLATGNAVLTHTQADNPAAKVNWGKEFPRILMEVREELRAEHLELNDTYDYSDWEYLEDSGYSGILESLPEKVEKDGKLTFRPKYDFGRIYLTEGEKRHIKENIKVLDESGNVFLNDVSKVNNILQYISKWSNSKGFKYITIPYREWKNLLQTTDKIFENDDSINQFETLVYNLETAAIENNYIDQDKHGEYNKQNNTITLDEDFYNFIKLLHNNIDALSDLLEITGQDIADTFDYIVDNGFADIYDLFSSEEYDSEYTLKYTYKDDRQLELFKDDPALREASTSNEHEQC